MGRRGGREGGREGGTMELINSVEVTGYQLQAIKGSNPRDRAKRSKNALLLLRSAQYLSIKTINQEEEE